MSDMPDNDETAALFRYRFTFGDATTKEFSAALDPRTFNLIRRKKDAYPAWTELNRYKCPNCTLDGNVHMLCPPAECLVDIVDFFRESFSYEEVDVIIESGSRTYSRHTSLQSGLSSLLGIYMATSGCPVMEQLKPMALYHLPFSTLEEVRYRVISMYLVAQYLRSRRGGEPDWDLKGLSRVYEDIRVVNENFYRRLLSAELKDANVNALAILNCFADFVTSSLEDDALDDLGPLFSAYLK